YSWVKWTDSEIPLCAGERSVTGCASRNSPTPSSPLSGHAQVNGAVGTERGAVGTERGAVGTERGAVGTERGAVGTERASARGGGERCPRRTGQPVRSKRT